MKKFIKSLANRTRIAEVMSVVGIVAISILIAINNIEPGTYLMGWDSVMSELNLPIAFDRAMSGVWQEFQGLGLLGGHGYVSDLVHSGLLWFIAKIAPLNLVRYMTIIFLWVLGGMGAYSLSRHYLTEWKSKKSKYLPWVSMITGLLYMLHPYTIQNFYVIHDAFAWFYGFLPWIVLSFVSLLKKWNYRKAVGFLIISFLASYMGFIPPVFLGLMATLLGMGVYWVMDSPKKLLVGRAKKLGVIMSLLVLGNLYWLMPVGVFSVTKPEIYLNSKLNSLTTWDNNIKSDAYATIGSVAKGRGYYFESLDISVDGEVGSPILGSWIDYWSKEGVSKTMMIFFGIFILGGLMSWKKRKSLRPMVVGAMLSFLVMIQAEWPVSSVFDLMENVPMLNQAFRISFTKFSSEYTLFMALLTGGGLMWLIEKMSKKKGKYLVWLSILGLFYISRPVFDGKMFYEKMRVDIPKEYFQLQNYMSKGRSVGRIATFPVHSFNGWQMNDWGYTGSGFLFYMLENPILDRAFDVWSEHNETFYNQLSLAVYAQDMKAIESLMEKYEVRYLLLDKSVIQPGKSKEVLFINNLSEMFEKSEKINLGKTIGFLDIFEYNQNTGSQLNTPEKYLLADWDSSYSSEDDVYKKYGDYVSGTNKGLIYPLSGFDGRREVDVKLVESRFFNNQDVIFQKSIDKNKTYQLSVDDYFSTNDLPAEVWIKSDGRVATVKLRLVSPELFIDGEIALESTVLEFESNALEAGDLDHLVLNDRVFNVSWVGGSEYEFLGYLPVSLGEKVSFGLGVGISGMSDGKTHIQLVDESDINLETAVEHESKNIKLSGVEEIEVRYPSVLENDVEWLSGTSEENCDAFDRGDVRRVSRNNEVFYRVSDGGVSCDYLDYSKVWGFDNYILRISGENKKGRSVKLGLTNIKSKVVDIEAQLSGGEFDESFVVYASSNSGFGLSIETKSIEGVTSENMINSVQMIPINISWMKSMRMIPYSDEKIRLKNVNLLELEDVGRWGTSHYWAGVDGGGLLELSQGFEKGWVGYKIDGKLGIMKKVMPWFFGKKLEHVKVNGWANGFMIPENDGGSVAIVYWPQYLEWLGLAFLIMTPMVIIKKKNRSLN